MSIIIQGITRRRHGVPKHFQPYLIGMTISLLSLGYSENCQCAMNPARDLGKPPPLGFENRIQIRTFGAPVLSNLRISSNLESDASIRNRIFRIFDSNRRVEIRSFEYRIRIWVRSSRFGSDSVRDSVRMFEIRRHCGAPTTVLGRIKNYMTPESTPMTAIPESCSEGHCFVFIHPILKTILFRSSTLHPHGRIWLGCV